MLDAAVVVLLWWPGQGVLVMSDAGRLVVADALPGRASGSPRFGRPDVVFLVEAAAALDEELEREPVHLLRRELPDLVLISGTQAPGARRLELEGEGRWRASETRAAESGAAETRASETGASETGEDAP